MDHQKEYYVAYVAKKSPSRSPVPWCMQGKVDGFLSQLFDCLFKRKKTKAKMLFYHRLVVFIRQLTRELWVEYITWLTEV